MDKSIHIVLDYWKCATSEILDNTTEWRPWKVQITILTSQYSHLISSHKKSFLLMKLLRTKISLYFYSKSLLLHHQCRRLLHILGTWSKLDLALNRSSRTKLQRKWGRKQLLPPGTGSVNYIWSMNRRLLCPVTASLTAAEHAAIPVLLPFLSWWARSATTPMASRWSCAPARQRSMC